MEEYSKRNNVEVLYEYIFFLHMMYNLKKDDKYKKELITLLDLIVIEKIIIKVQDSNTYEKTIFFDILLGTLYLKKIYKIGINDEIEKVRTLLEKGIFNDVYGNLKILDYTYDYFMKNLGLQYNLKNNNKFNHNKYFGDREDKLYVATHSVIFKSNFFNNIFNDFDKNYLEYLIKNLDFVIEKEYIDLIGEYLMCSIAFQKNGLEINMKKIWNLVNKYTNDESIVYHHQYTLAQNLHATHSILLGMVVDKLRRCVFDL
ncbi:hypothetical protein FJM09_03310 [Clostridium perfringens]|nr:hypothetical protein FJM09_03310 [Clostridium perfringens]